MNTNNSQEESIPFGVGSFHFGIGENAPSPLTASEYAAEIERVLCSITSISNVQIEVTDDDQVETPGKFISIREQHCFYPLFDIFSFSFDIYVPKRVQEDVTEHIYPRSLNAENFRVFVQNDFRTSICFVWPRTDQHVSSPSDSVVIIREYLEAEIAKIDSYLKFQFLGPSPFHANFVLEPGGDREYRPEEDQFLVTNNRLRSYDEITVTYSQSHFRDCEEAFEVLRDHLSAELDLYYEITLGRNLQVQEWLDLQEIVANLTTTNVTGFLKRALTAIKRGRELRKAHNALAEIEFSQVFIHRQHTRSYQQTYESSEVTFIKPYLESKIDSPHQYPTRAVERLLSFLEERRSKAQELAVVLIAAIVGGVVGSLFTKHLDSSAREALEQPQIQQQYPATDASSLKEEGD